MERNKSHLQKKMDTGYQLEFGQVFEKGFEIFKNVFAQAGVAIILFSILSGVVNFTLMTFIFEINFLEMSEVGFELKDQEELKILIYVLITTLIVGLITPMSVGILLLCKQAHKKEEVRISSIFELYNTAHFKEIFIFSTLLSLISSFTSLGLDMIELPLLLFVFYPLVYLFTYLVYPLIVFQNLSAFEAVGVSFNLVGKNVFIILALIIVAALASLLGFFALCIGIFFTIPFYYCILFSIYESILPFEENHEMDLIGQNDEE